MTLHLNKKHVLIQVERSEEVLKTAFLVTTKKTSPPEIKKTFLELTQRRFGSFVFRSRKKGVFLNIRFHKTSQTQDAKSESTKRSLRKLAQPKRDCAFEQKPRNVPSRQTLGSSQKFFLVTTKEKNKAELKLTLLERTQRGFGKFLFSFW